MPTVSRIGKKLLVAALSTLAMFSLGARPLLAQQGPGVTDQEIRLGTWLRRPEDL